ncbi:MAG: methyltransferase, partial [Candidatus Helarchaeota archaeon]|nr:methyltransferase [Candidatus Helarchaeota archaeon]
ISPFLKEHGSNYSLKYFLGISNSKLISWYGGRIMPNFGKEIFPKLNPQDILSIPIYKINFSDPDDVSRHDRMVSLVESMLALHKQFAAARLPDEKERLQRQIQSTDRQIDRLVYELYGLTEEEIKIVEGEV